MSPFEFQQQVTRRALTVLRHTAFALAGSGAIREHGITDRPTQDVDLFTSDLDPHSFAVAVDLLIDNLRTDGYAVEEARRAERFARLLVTDDHTASVEIDLGVDWREAEPVTLSIGPVLGIDDAVGNKVSALYSRAEARDYLDVDAIRRSGRFTDEELLAAARERDAGFEVPMFVQQLQRIARIRPQQVADYGVDAAEFAEVQRRILAWAAQLTP